MTAQRLGRALAVLEVPTGQLYLVTVVALGEQHAGCGVAATGLAKPIAA